MTGAAHIGLDELPLRDDLRGQSPYGAPQLDVPYPLNTNENSFPLPAALIEAIPAAAAAVAGGLNRYPDRDAVALRADLAAYLGRGLSVGEVWAANGSNEILQQIFQTFAGPGRTVLGFTPSYSMHPILARGAGSAFIDGMRAGDFTLSAAAAARQIEAHRPDVVILCSPNNPTGTALGIEVVRAALAAAPGMVIVDEAYAEFARPGAISAIELLPGAPRLIVTRTMSKAFGMAGLRLGYLAAASAVVDAIQLVRLPYHLSALTQAVARAALAHADALLSAVEAIKEQRDRIVRACADLGCLCPPSDANFVLVGRFADAARAWRLLLDQGVLVRDVGMPGWLRVTAGTPAETAAFLDALAAILRDDPALLLPPAPATSESSAPATPEPAVPEAAPPAPVGAGAAQPPRGAPL
ncbi:MAG: histidinol-phosphate transaminase [Frankiaceae bacterium]|jgi:histidinol-phosphate aminotransferase|nr:histidinol-phosphate transaminase [Frankiaceae bacterium]